MQPQSNPKKIFILAVVLVLIGAFSFSYSENINFSESLYRSLYIVLSHHDNFHFSSTLGRAMVIILIFFSLLIIAYLLKWLVEYMIGLGDGLKKRQMKSKIAKMNQHYIICGLGRVGKQVAQELADEGVDFVGIDRDESKVKEVIDMGGVAFVGDSTKEETIRQAKVDKAKGLISSLGEDSNNLFVTLTARQINPGIFIISRSNSETNKKRLEHAGADRVAMPYQIGAYHMATMMVRPNVVDFLDVMSKHNLSDLQIEVLVIAKSSPLVGEPISWLNKHNTGVMVLAINSNDGSSKVNPIGSEKVYSGDRLIIMGTRSQLDTISQII